MRHLIALAFGFQALAGVGWWAALALHPPSRRWFLPPELPDLALLAFWLADLVLFVGGSALVAVLVARESPHARAALLVVTGAVCYATLTTLAISLWTGAAWLGTGLMGASAGLCLASCVLIPRAR